MKKPVQLYSAVVTRGVFNPISANPTKLSNTMKQFFGNLPTNCLSVFDHFVGLALKGLRLSQTALVELFHENS